jgi:hypothetical protein
LIHFPIKTELCDYHLQQHKLRSPRSLRLGIHQKIYSLTKILLLSLRSSHIHCIRRAICPSAAGLVCRGGRGRLTEELRFCSLVSRVDVVEEKERNVGFAGGRSLAPQRSTFYRCTAADLFHVHGTHMLLFYQPLPIYFFLSMLRAPSSERTNQERWHATSRASSSPGECEP